MCRNPGVLTYDWTKNGGQVTDDSVMMSRIYEALAAIEQRRLTPVTNEDELVALIAAEAGLQSMITERTSKPV